MGKKLQRSNEQKKTKILSMYNIVERESSYFFGLKNEKKNSSRNCVQKRNQINQKSQKEIPAWWLQPSWNILVKLKIFPQIGVKIKTFETTT